MLMRVNKQHQQGFTLIELVIVIIILGILSASAIPKFVNLQSDAKKAVLSGLEGAIQDAVNLSHYKLLVSGHSETAYVKNMPVTSSQNVTMFAGFPHVGRDTGGGIPDEPDIVDILELSADITITRPAAGFNTGYAQLELATNCYVKYTEARFPGSAVSGTLSERIDYKIEKVDTGC